MEKLTSYSGKDRINDMLTLGERINVLVIVGNYWFTENDNILG